MILKYFVSLHEEHFPKNLSKPHFGLLFLANFFLKWLGSFLKIPHFKCMVSSEASTVISVKTWIRSQPRKLIQFFLRYQYSTRTAILFKAVKWLLGSQYFKNTFIQFHEIFSKISWNKNWNKQLTQMTKPSRTANSMQISFCHFGKVKVNDYINGLNVNSASK